MNHTERDPKFEAIVVLGLVIFMAVSAIGIKLWEKLDRVDDKVAADQLVAESLRRLADRYAPHQNKYDANLWNIQKRLK